MTSDSVVREGDCKERPMSSVEGGRKKTRLRYRRLYGRCAAAHPHGGRNLPSS